MGGDIFSKDKDLHRAVPDRYKILFDSGISFAIRTFKYLIFIINLVQGPKPLVHYRKARCK